MSPKRPCSPKATSHVPEGDTDGQTSDKDVERELRPDAVRTSLCSLVGEPYKTFSAGLQTKDFLPFV